ncbi:hypothetical protein [Stenotrophobium rhamnosiphilum]|uniref:Uncharacterized protein n=1 Tax=Stenotrophobium rhamnosiphilum TaxID=2029166 RepID=A0A2T5MEG8_9GAMM|nr:hypothetical protein [Stenotrophobium rhamnosiphilum]PTU30957.1 hypothetical protein CJD38_11665 [Stenotrophobium rhamnosiphilum]
MSRATVVDGEVSEDINVDAWHRFTHGDWVGYDFISLLKAGLIKRDETWAQFYVCTKLGEKYTVAAIRGGHTKSIYTRQAMERAATQKQAQP